VLGLATGFVVSSRVPPQKVLELSSSNTRAGRRELEIPRSVVLVVSDDTVPLPVLSDPLSSDVSTILGKDNIAVEIITPQTCRGTAFAHVNGEPVHLSVLETVTGQKVVGRRHRTVFQKALGTHVKSERNHVLSPDVVHTVRAGQVGTNSVLVLASLEDGRIACKVTVVSC
jgi:hypothetical protein